MRTIQLRDCAGTVLHSRNVPTARAPRIRYARVAFPRGGYPRIVAMYGDYATCARASSLRDQFCLPVIGGAVRLPF